MPDEIVLEKQSTDFVEIGETGLKRSFGVITEEFLPDLAGQNGIRVYKEMALNDPIVGAIILVIKNLIRQAEWRVEPVSEDNRDLEIAEFVESCMEDMRTPWKQLISEILSMVVYGWSFFEVVYKKRQGNVADVLRGSRFNDNRIGWRDISIRSQDTLFEWLYDDNGNLVGMAQMPPPDFTRREIPMSKGLLFRTTHHKNNPEGESVLRKAYRPWYFKKRIEEIEAIGLERDLNGIPVAWVPGKLLKANPQPEDAATLARIREMVKNVRHDEQVGLVLPQVFDERGNKMFDFGLMTTRGRRNFNTNAIIGRYNRLIAMSALADFIILGHENVGSFALASSKTHVFSIAVSAYMEEIAEVFNKNAIPKLLQLNGLTDVDMPKLIHTDVEALDLGELARFIKELAVIDGTLTERPVVDYLREQAGIPLTTEDPSEIDVEIIPDDNDNDDD